MVRLSPPAIHDMTTPLHEQLDVLDRLRAQEQVEKLTQAYGDLYGDKLPAKWAEQAIAGSPPPNMVSVSTPGSISKQKIGQGRDIAGLLTMVTGLSAGALAWTAMHVRPGQEAAYPNGGVFDALPAFSAQPLWVLSGVLAAASVVAGWQYLRQPKANPSPSLRKRWANRVNCAVVVVLGSGLLTAAMAYGVSRYSPSGSYAVVSDEFIRFGYDHDALKQALGVDAEGNLPATATAAQCALAHKSVEDFTHRPHTRLGLILANALNKTELAAGCLSGADYLKQAATLVQRGQEQVSLSEAMPWPLSKPGQLNALAIQSVLDKATTRVGWCEVSPEWTPAVTGTERFEACLAMPNQSAPMAGPMSLKAMGVTAK